jgi:hypothetical protein
MSELEPDEEDGEVDGEGVGVGSRHRVEWSRYLQLLQEPPN